MSTEISQRCVKNKKGFTIVETLVAISILVIALTGPLAIIAQSLKSSYFSRDEITAAYLAQEPIEYIRNVRDQNGLREADASMWLKGISTDPINGNLVNTPGGTTNAKSIKLALKRQSGHFVLAVCTIDCVVKYNPANGVYGEDDTLLPPSIFTREVYLNQADSDTDSERELVITSIVSWSTGGISHNVTLTEHLFNWQLEKTQ